MKNAFTFDGITSVSLHALVCGFSGFIFTDIDFQSVLHSHNKGRHASVFHSGTWRGFSGWWKTKKEGEVCSQDENKKRVVLKLITHHTYSNADSVFTCIESDQWWLVSILSFMWVCSQIAGSIMWPLVSWSFHQIQELQGGQISKAAVYLAPDIWKVRSFVFPRQTCVIYTFLNGHSVLFSLMMFTHTDLCMWPASSLRSSEKTNTFHHTMMFWSDHVSLFSFTLISLDTRWVLCCRMKQVKKTETNNKQTIQMSFTSISKPVFFSKPL